MRIELCDCENVILREIADPRFKRKAIATTYALCLMQQTEKIDWKKINGAIIARWSYSALEYIKDRAWGIAEGRIDSVVDWKAFDEAVEYLKQYLATDGKLWQSAIVSAHHVRDMLADIGVNSQHDIQAPKGHWVTLYRGCHACGEIVQRACDTFPEAVLAAVTSKKFADWRRAHE